MFYFELTNENIDRSRITSKGQWLAMDRFYLKTTDTMQVIEFFTKWCTHVDWIDTNKIANNCKIGILETED